MQKIYVFSTKMHLNHQNKEKIFPKNFLKKKIKILFNFMITQILYNQIKGNTIKKINHKKLSKIN